MITLTGMEKAIVKAQQEKLATAQKDFMTAKTRVKMYQALARINNAQRLIKHVKHNGFCR
jgi:hypothetical protein